MKSSARTLILATLLMTFAGTLLAASGGSANGSFKFTNDGFAFDVQFHAKQNSAGGDGSGSMVFTGGAEIPDQDVDGEGFSGPVGTINVRFRVDFDCAKVNEEGTRAAMSGLVTDSSVPAYLGRRLVLAVEDDGEPNRTDRYHWGAYRATEGGWTPEDAEVPGDIGWSLSWTADDFEQPGSPVPNSRSTLVDCRSFALSAYDLRDLDKSQGNIQVKK